MFNPGKYILWLFLFCVSELSAQHDISLTAKYDNRNIAFVLKDLTEKYDLSFAFDSFELANITGSWAFDNATIDQVLQALLYPKGYDYKWIDETAIIFRSIQTLNPVETDPHFYAYLTGEIRDISTHELLPYAALHLKGTPISESADADGKFKIQLTESLTDTLQVFFVGYEFFEIAIGKIERKDHISIYLTLARTYLPDVLIQANGVKSIEVEKRPSMDVINPSQVTARYGAGESDVFRATQLLPGISATQESNNGLYLRGNNSDQTLVSFDGFTIYHLDHFFGTFSALNTDAIKSVRIQKGSPDARFGGRTAGVVEITGKEGDLKRTRSQMNFGLLSIGASLETPLDSLGKSSVIVTARRSITDAIYSPAYKSLFNTIYNSAMSSSNEKKTQSFGSRNDPQFYFQDANVKFTFRPTQRSFLNLSLYTSKDKLFFQYADSSKSEVTNSKDIFYTDESTKKNTGGSVRMGYSINNNWQLLFNLGISQFQGDYFSADTIRENLFQSDSIRFGSEKTILDDVNSRIELIGKYRNQTLNTGFQWNKIISSDQKNANGVLNDGASQSGEVLTYYISDEFVFRKRVHFVPGIRLNYFDNTHRFYPEPRVMCFYSMLDDALNIKFSAGRTNQFVQRVQTQSLYLNTPDYWKIATANGLDVMTSDNVSTGMTLNRKGWILDAEVFHIKKKGNVLSPGNYAQPSNGLAFSNTILTGSGRSVGVDVMIQKNYKRHQLLLGYSILKAYSKFSELDQSVVPEFFEQRHELKLNYELKLARWNFSLLWLYGTGRPYTPLLGTYNFMLPDGNVRRLPVFGDLNSARLPSYQRLDVVIAYSFMIGKAQATLFGAVYNAYNQHNIRGYQYLAIRYGQGQNDYKIIQRSLSMIGILPTINFTIKF